MGYSNRAGIWKERGFWRVMAGGVCVPASEAEGGGDQPGAFGAARMWQETRLCDPDWRKLGLPRERTAIGLSRG